VVIIAISHVIPADSAGVDAAAYEPETGLLFASTREGMIHIFHEDSPNKFSEVETVKTEFGAKTMGFDSQTQHLFVDTADFWSSSKPDRRASPPAAVRDSRDISRVGLWQMNSPLFSLKLRSPS